MMSQGDRSAKTDSAGAATGAAALRAQYRATRARLLGAPPSAAARPSAPTPRAAMRPRTARRARRRLPLWLGDLVAFNEELRRLFLGGATTAANAAGDRIAEVVAAHYRITAAEIEGDGANRRIAWPRQVAMYICARHAGMPSPQIGRLFGDRDQSTARFAVVAVEGRIAKDPVLAAEIERLVEQWRAGKPA